MVPLDHYEDDKNATKGSANPEEKHKHVKSIIISSAKPVFFGYLLDWCIVDSLLSEWRIRPWINKKITEHTGEKELY